MKKVLFFSTLVAAVLLAASCQKEQEVVTLGAVISHPDKTYIDDRYPCWNSGDQVFVNTAAYPVTHIAGSSAQIDLVAAADGYRAFFPASLVASGSDITLNGNIPVTLPATQTYTLVDGHQRVDAPMGAFTTGSTLQFHNLCSILHVMVNNSTGSSMTLDRLVIAADQACLSGTGSASVNGTENDCITLGVAASHTVALDIAGGAGATLAVGDQATFDIYIPAFTTDNVTLTLYTTDHQKFQLTKQGVALEHNTLTPVTMNVTSLIAVSYAILKSGSDFYRDIRGEATSVVFEYNSSVNSGRVLSTADSPYLIYGNLVGTVWTVSTSADIIYANPNCYRMFYNKSSLTSINFGSGFHTENVTSMEGMFNGCGRLTSLDLSSFNTENVTNMSYMFSGCSSLTSLDLSSLNTENVTNMQNMFATCRSLTSLNLSHFNTGNVTNMSNMFNNCNGLTSLNLSSFNTRNVTNMNSMFYNCDGLTSLDLSSFNTGNVTNMGTMFIYCSSLTSLNLSSFNTGHVTNMRSMFNNCRNLTSLDLSHFDMNNVTDKSLMCSSLSTTSGACTITCPLAVQTALQSGTSLPTSGVTFNWVIL